MTPEGGDGQWPGWKKGPTAVAWSTDKVDKAILDSLNIPVLVSGADGGIRHGNAAAGRFWRVLPAKLTDYTLSHLFAGDERIGAAVVRAVTSEASSTIEPVLLQSAGGRSNTVLRIQVDPLQSSGEQAGLAVVAIWDETRRERIASASHEARMRQSMGSMLKGLAHELQNPLSGIKGATQLLARKLGQSSSHSEYPEVILKELERLERLIKNLLAHGDNPPLNPVDFNLHELLDEVLWFIANSHAQLEMVREYDPSLPDCHADRDRLHQVFLNLLRNAAEASPAGGTVRIRTRIAGPWSEEEQLPDPGRIYFQIEVEDQGQGISESHREQLFTPFFTTKATGTGLGLSISHQIVMAHNGWLRQRNITPHGSVFTVIIPVME